jgi:hypothetical protein
MMISAQTWIGRTIGGIWLAALLALGGCAAQRATPAAATPPPEPFVLHLPGVAGTSIFDQRFIKALQAGGMEARYAIYDWTCHDPGMNALHAYARNQQQAKKIADALAGRYHDDPRGEIFLTGHSGGAGLVVWALEKLPPDVMVDSVILLSPAISPMYDLSAALRHVRHHLYVFSSDGDSIVLGAGTRLFGTIDGVKTAAAGLVGFTMPESADANQYRKIVPEPYQSAWLALGNIGDHMGSLAAPFARAIIAPLLMGQGLPPQAAPQNAVATPVNAAPPAGS